MNSNDANDNGNHCEFELLGHESKAKLVELERFDFVVNLLIFQIWISENRKLQINFLSLCIWNPHLADVLKSPVQSATVSFRLFSLVETKRKKN